MMGKTLSTVLLLAVAGFLLASGTALAAEGEINLFAGDVGNAIWTLVIFIVLILVLGKFAWGPMLGALQQRENFIRHSLEQAKDDRESAEKLLNEYTVKLGEASAEAKKILEDGRGAGEKIRMRMEDEARQESEKIIDRARREIEMAKQSAIKDLYAESAQLATELASRIVKRELTASDHERMIAESLDELAQLDKN